MSGVKNRGQTPEKQCHMGELRTASVLKITLPGYNVVSTGYMSFQKQNPSHQTYIYI